MYSERLKRLRTEKGLRQGEVADLLGISAPAYANYENGKSAPPLDKLIALAKHFEVSLDWLCGIEKKEPLVKVESQGDVARFVLALLETKCFDVLSEFNHHEECEYMRIEPVRANGSRYLEPSWFDCFLSDYNKLNDLRKASTITQEIFNQWLTGVLKKMDTIKLEMPEEIIY